MSAIKSLCEKIDKTFFNVLAESSQAASYLLASLYRYKATAKNHDKERLQATLRALKKKLQPPQIQLIWEEINSFTLVDWQALDLGTQKSLSFLKKYMLAHRTYLGALPMTALLALGKKPDWYRDVLIALVRKHLLSLQQPDPFIRLKFSFSLLRKGGAEQNFLYLSRYLEKCASLPIEEITTLGSQDGKVAELILKDLTNTLGYFQVSANFVAKHIQLRLIIAKQWQAYFDTYPLDEKIQTFIQAKLPDLKKQYPEFRNITLDSKVTRHYHVHPPSASQNASAPSRRLHFRYLRPALTFVVDGIQHIAQKARMWL